MDAKTKNAEKYTEMCLMCIKSSEAICLSFIFFNNLGKKIRCLLVQESFGFEMFKEPLLSGLGSCDENFFRCVLSLLLWEEELKVRPRCLEAGLDEP